MKKILTIIMSFVIALSTFITPAWAEGTAMYDIDITEGEYAGYKKLMNHSHASVYDIYFKYKKEGSICSMQIVPVSLISEDLSEIVTITDSLGDTVTLSRGDWYRVFSKLNGKPGAADALQELYGDFYRHWALQYTGITVSKIAENYINETYFGIPANRGMTPGWGT